jgi:hypothetical protein
LKKLTLLLVGLIILSIYPSICESDSEHFIYINTNIELPSISEMAQSHIITVEKLKTQGKVVEAELISLELPKGVTGKFKTYMDYRMITNKNSKQYQLQQECWTDSDGLRRYGDLYVVALGTYYSSVIGDRFTIELNNGTMLNVVVGDIKDDRHTDKTNRYIPFNGNIVEFIVDVDMMDELPKKMGDVSYVENINLNGDVLKIYKMIEGYKYW